MCQTCLKQLGVKSRLKIYNLIKSQKQASVGDIVQKMNLTQPTVSYHLIKMEEAGLLTKKKTGRNVFYSISKMCKKKGAACALALADLGA